MDTVPELGFWREEEPTVTTVERPDGSEVAVYDGRSRSGDAPSTALLAVDSDATVRLNEMR